MLRGRWVGAAGAAALLLAGLMAPATASAVSDEGESYREFLSVNGADPAVQDELVAKFEAGVLPDSARGVDPVDTREFTEGSLRVIVNEYEDGSLLRAEVSLPTTGGGEDGTAGPQNLGQCVLVGSTRTSDTYDNCFVSANNGFSRASFRTGYTVRSPGHSSVTNGWSPSVTCYVCSVSAPTIEIVRQNSTSALPAEVRMSWIATAVGGWPSGTSYLALRVTHSGLRSTPNNLIPWEN